MKVVINGHEVEGEPEEIRKLLGMSNNMEIKINSIPLACRNCSNHPSNGGPGDCNCILGGYQFTC